jgi:5-methylcytosine-specific restriction enzyme A
MPRKPPRICTTCGDVVDGVCPKCGGGTKGWTDDRIRGNRHQRGYGNDWVKTRDAYLDSHPLCEYCLEKRPEVLTPNTADSPLEVHHKIPFHGINDPLRLDPTNLKTACPDCHRSVTGRRR